MNLIQVLIASLRIREIRIAGKIAQSTKVGVAGLAGHVVAPSIFFIIILTLGAHKQIKIFDISGFIARNSFTMVGVYKVCLLEAIFLLAFIAMKVIFECICFWIFINIENISAFRSRTKLKPSFLKLGDAFIKLLLKNLYVFFFTKSYFAYLFYR